MSSKKARIVTIVGDGITGLFVAATIVVLVVQLAARFLEGPILTLLGIWALLVSVLSIPALAILYLSTPRVPLKERSALVASANWFGRVLWSAFVFSASIVLGSVAGIVATGTGQQGDEVGDGLATVIASLSTMVLWPIVLGVGATAYVAMGVRWSVDLGSIVAEDRGAVVRSLLEHRWIGPLPAAPRWTSLVDLLVEVGLN